MLTQVRSGFQSGWDIAGIRAAQALGIPTGGWMPKGFLVLEDGPGGSVAVHKPEYATEYGAEEANNATWTQRTDWNVRDSDLTVIFSFADSRGTQCAVNAAGPKRHNKPVIRLRPQMHFNIATRYHYLRDADTDMDYRDPKTILHYALIFHQKLLETGGSGVLNIAGNRFQYFEESAEVFLSAVFHQMILMDSI